MKQKQWVAVISLIVLWMAFVRIANRITQTGGSGFAAPALEAPLNLQKKTIGWRLLDISGQQFDWSETNGKLILINIWATWCPPCREELPSLAALANSPELQDKLEVLCVSTDDSPSQLKSFLDQRNLDLPAYFAPDLPSDFITQGIPATFLLKPDGTLIGFEIGAAKWDSPEFINQIKKMSPEI